ncbi:MAG: DNA-directed RNA polymerase subunit B, partial [Methanomassiliicoccales archaeon]|nr:DNA-directed RNA polymerase subunit B [Methanomassiliicoccales archaeon]
MRDLVELYFKERSIVNHHISSFNDFLSTMDNPNSRMQNIVDNLRVSAEDLDRGIIRLDPEKTDGKIVEIRVGRKRDEKTGLTDSHAKPTVRIKLPEIREANGYVHDLTPMEARLRNLNYLAPVFIDFTVIE